MSIIKKILLLVLLGCLLLILLGCASSAPLPATLNIIPPSNDVPSRLGAFSGIWEERGFDIVLVVERIDSQKADVILSFGVSPGFDPHYAYYIAQVTSDSTIKLTEPNGDIIIFEMDEELNDIAGTVIEKKAGAKYKLFMVRRKTK